MIEFRYRSRRLRQRQKNIVIKIIKRNATPELRPVGSVKLPPAQTVTETVNEWIAESRQMRIDKDDSSSRKTIVGWADQANS